MITLLKSDTIHSLTEIKSKLYKQVQDLPQKFSMIGNFEAILRMEFLLEPVDILTWLNNQSTEKKIYWSNRDKSFEVGGVGSADVVTGSTLDLKTLSNHFEDHLLNDNPNLRYYGGMAFDDRESAEWKKFGRYFFMVPRFELLKQSDQCLLAFNIACDEISEDNIKAILEEIAVLSFAPTTEYRRPAPKVIDRKDTPNKEAWVKKIGQTVNDIRKGDFQKLVLARRSSFIFDRAINPIALIKHLKDMTPNCYHYCFQLGAHVAFLGASPEQLISKKDDALTTEALAATIERSESQDKLLSSQKHLKEHEFVVNTIESDLKPFCEKVTKDKAGVMKLNEGQHLVTHFTAKTKPSADWASIVSAMHPTPAVGGLPRTKAMEAIKSLEPFSRGLYAAPIGYVGAQNCEFAVGIRSGLVQENHLSLFAGAGIILESNPEEEWEEIEHKIGSWIKVFKL